MSTAQRKATRKSRPQQHTIVITIPCSSIMLTCSGPFFSLPEIPHRPDWVFIILLQKCNNNFLLIIFLIQKLCYIKLFFCFTPSRSCATRSWHCAKVRARITPNLLLYSDECTCIDLNLLNLILSISSSRSSSVGVEGTGAGQVCCGSAQVLHSVRFHSTMSLREGVLREK